MTFAERFKPDHTGLAIWLRRQHLARYRWAARWVPGREVIDAACGIGYGAVLLADAGAARVTGFDVDPAALADAAAAARHHDRVTIAHGDVTRLPVADAGCDVYVSFETIEHVTDDGAFLREARRVLRPGGVFVCSTPNRDLFNPGTTATDKPLNPFHVREYTPAEFRGRVGSVFDRVEWYGQTDFGRGYAAALGAVGRRFARPAARLHQVYKLASSPWDRPAAHAPAPLASLAVPEILIAVCRV